MGRAKTFGNEGKPRGMIRTEQDGDVTVVTLDRPKRRNAFTPEGLDRLEAAIADAETPVLYLRGEGPAFSAGADFDTVQGLDAETAPEFSRKGQAVAAALETADGVVVAGIDGHAHGGGLELALACDVRVATPRSTVAEPGVKLGLFGAWGGTTRLPEVVGAADAMDLALSGRTIDAEEARRIGLVSRVVEDPRTVADEIAAHPSDALRLVKERLRDDADRPTQERREREAFATLIERHGKTVRERFENGR
jgi:enoyl-CoA hydratase/carnithine racemase